MLDSVDSPRIKASLFASANSLCDAAIGEGGRTFRLIRAQYFMRHTYTLIDETDTAWSLLSFDVFGSDGAIELSRDRNNPWRMEFLGGCFDSTGQCQARCSNAAHGFTVSGTAIKGHLGISAFRSGFLLVNGTKVVTAIFPQGLFVRQLLVRAVPEMHIEAMLIAIWFGIRLCDILPS